MVYSAIRQMRGDMAIESKPGEGTSVKLILPASATTDDAPEAQSADARSKAKPTIVLYVEDNLLVSLATVDLLEGAGYSIHAAPDGKRALALLREHPEIELLITDVGLPGMNGHELAAEVRRLRPDLKVVFLSGYDRTQWTGEPAEGAGTSYLGKPYQERDLLDTLQRLSDGAGTGTGRSA
jgi:CheY-like chemotaxis protein